MMGWSCSDPCKNCGKSATYWEDHGISGMVCFHCGMILETGVFEWMNLEELNEHRSEEECEHWGTDEFKECKDCDFDYSQCSNHTSYKLTELPPQTFKL